ncbi:response regulator transcription factor [Nocardia takedensis]
MPAVFDLRRDDDPLLAASAMPRVLAAGLPTVVLVDDGRTDLVRAFLDLGAVACLTGSQGSDHLIDALHGIRGALHGIGAATFGETAPEAELTRPVLTAREREILLAWFQTESKTAAGQRLYITGGTVSTHLKRIRAKYAALGRPAATKAALVARAIQDGLVDPDDL